MISKDGFVSWCHNCQIFLESGIVAVKHTMEEKHTVSTYSKNYCGRGMMGLPWPKEEFCFDGTYEETKRKPGELLKAVL